MYLVYNIKIVLCIVFNIVFCGMLLDSELTMKPKLPAHASTTCAGWDSWNFPYLETRWDSLSQNSYLFSWTIAILFSTDCRGRLLLHSSTYKTPAACLVLGLSSPDHVSSALQMLHCLPIYYGIQFKFARFMYSALTGQCPEYIKDVVTPVTSDPGRQHLQSSARSDFIVPRSKTKFGGRTFSLAGTEVWNHLPQSLWSAASVRQFKRTLKAHYFEPHFN